MVRSPGLCLLELVALATSTAAPAAEPTPIRIEFEKGAACSTPEEFYDAVRGRSDRIRLAQPGERAFYVRVNLTRTGANVRGELRVIHEHGETNPRSVEGDSCEVVVGALSLTAALAVDAVVAEGAQAAPPPAPVPVSAPSAAATSEAPAPPPEQETSVAGILGLQAVAAQVLAPGVELGAGLHGRLRIDTPGAFDPSFGLSLIHARNDLFEDKEPAVVRWSAANLSVCPGRLDLGDVLGVEPCLLGSAGLLSVTGAGLDDPEVRSRSWWSAGVLLRTRAALGAGVALELELGAAVPLVERTFVTRPSGDVVAETETVSPFVSLGISYEL